MNAVVTAPQTKHSLLLLPSYLPRGATQFSVSVAARTSRFKSTARTSWRLVRSQTATIPNEYPALASSRCPVNSLMQACCRRPRGARCSTQSQGRFEAVARKVFGFPASQCPTGLRLSRGPTAVSQAHQRCAFWRREPGADGDQ